MARNRVPRGNLTEGARYSKSAARTARPAGGGAPWARWPRCTTTDQGQLILPMNTSTHQLRVQLDVRTGVQVARRGAGAVSPVDLCGYLSRPHPSRGQLHPTAAYAAEPGATRRNSQSIASNDTSALRCWLLTSVPTPICLCKPFSCKACPGIQPDRVSLDAML